MISIMQTIVSTLTRRLPLIINNSMVAINQTLRASIIELARSKIMTIPSSSLLIKTISFKNNNTNNNLEARIMLLTSPTINGDSPLQGRTSMKSKSTISLNNMDISSIKRALWTWNTASRHQSVAHSRICLPSKKALTRVNTEKKMNCHYLRVWSKISI